MSQQHKNDIQRNCYSASAADFGKIPGSPIAYWLSDSFRRTFDNTPSVKSFSKASTGLQTSNSDEFLRFWWEIPLGNDKWFPFAKGGEYRKWYGNVSHVVNWENNGYAIKNYVSKRYPYLNGNYGLVVKNEGTYFKKGILTSRVTSGGLGFRLKGERELYSDACTAIFPEHTKLFLGILSSKLTEIMQQLNPTINFQAGDLEKFPIAYPRSIKSFEAAVDNAVAISKEDWDRGELSSEFKVNCLLGTNSRLSDCCASVLSKFDETTRELKEIEEFINHEVICAYGLEDDLKKEIDWGCISLNANPAYKYKESLGAVNSPRMRSDLLSELISYSIGCMMGRYSLDREGLVYAHAGNEGFKALVEEGAYATFAADEDGILPLSTDSWFADDVATRLEAFVCSVWGKETLEENLQFIADSLCLAAIKPVKKGGETSRETLRRYLSTQFYKDHLKTYKKRPIYWLFSSGKEKAFECLVYLHRYNEATLPRMRTEYVTPLLGQMASRIERLRLQQTEASTSDAKRIGKEIDSLTKQLSELRAFDDQLKHHADMRITLDLDDGVKVNYGKFGTLLSDVKAITGDKGE
ncbi:BREX-1 system adenine-specific DNA-methyltransferase PglX [Aeromonas veronii]|uniref:BREX-1 system adenine-specific DNA-methyltransferase PglX n=2 Tax=Aeromonas TaxID=642 RepID=UPI003D2549F8